MDKFNKQIYYGVAIYLFILLFIKMVKQISSCNSDNI